MITNVKTIYSVTLDKPVIVTDEYHYENPEYQSRTTVAFEVTEATVTIHPGEEPYVTLFGFALLPNGERSKRQRGKVTSVPRVGVVTLDMAFKATADYSAYDKAEAAVLAEVVGAEAEPEAEPNIPGGYYPGGPLRSRTRRAPKAS